MENNDTRQKGIVVLCKILYFMLPLLVSWLALSLMSKYMKFYDIGVNAGANNGFLMFFIAPLLLVGLYIIATLCIFIGKYVKASQYISMAIGGFLIIVCGLAAFFFYAQAKSEYPTEQPQNMAVFLKSYFLE